jgi:hypothetical protein
MRQFDLVMFDLDGTLVETAPEIMDAVNDTLARFDLPLVSQQQVNDWIGHGTLSLLVEAVAFATGRPLDEVRASELLRTMVAEYNVFYGRRCGTRSHLYPQVRETLEALRAQGSKLAVVTNKEGRYTQIVMAVQKLTDLFRCGDQRRHPCHQETRPGRCGALPAAVWCDRRSVRCLWVIPALMRPRPAPPGWPFGCCPTATTWANRSRPAQPDRIIRIVLCYLIT